MVGALRQPHLPGRDRDRAAAGRAAAGQRQVPRIAGAAEPLFERGAAGAELRCVRLRHHDAAFAFDPLHQRMRARWHMVPEDRRAIRRAHPGHVVQVLDRHRQPVEPARLVRLRRVARRHQTPGVFPRAIETKCRQRVHLRFHFGDPRLGRVDQFQWGDFPFAQSGHRLGRGHADQVLGHRHLLSWASTLARCRPVVQAGRMTPHYRLILLLLLGGCTTLGPNFTAPGWSGPESWFNREPRAPVSQTVEAPIDPNWWTLFNDPTLTALEQRVAEENIDVAIAALRIDESRAQYDSAVSAGVPDLNANASYARQKASNVGTFANAPNPLGASGALGANPGALGSRKLSAFDVYQVGFDASWELDLWGKIRRSVEAAGATARASEEARRGVLLTNLAEVARDY